MIRDLIDLLSCRNRWRKLQRKWPRWGRDRRRPKLNDHCLGNLRFKRNEMQRLLPWPCNRAQSFWGALVSTATAARKYQQQSPTKSLHAKFGQCFALRAATKCFSGNRVFWHKPTLCAKNYGLFQALNPPELDCEYTSSRIFNDSGNSCALLAVIEINFNFRRNKASPRQGYVRANDTALPRRDYVVHSSLNSR